MNLEKYTTLRVGGPAEEFIEVHSEDELRGAIEFGRKRNFPITVIGGGSNVLVSDEGIPGVVIKVSLRGIAFAEERGTVSVRVDAGENWDSFVVEAIDRGLWGVENLSGIPGTVGASPIQNIGAYGTEVKEVVERVEAIDRRDGSTKVFSNAECTFSYRDSFFKSSEGKEFLITAVTFRLSRDPRPNLSYKDVSSWFDRSGSAPTLRNIREAILKIRSGKFPDLSRIGTAGSFFKNPIISKVQVTNLEKKFPGVPVFPLLDGRAKVSLAWILDNVCHLKGFREGNVALYERQPLVLVNFGTGNAKEIDAFAREIEAVVRKKAGIEILREVIMIGNFS